MNNERLKNIAQSAINIISNIVEYIDDMKNIDCSKERILECLRISEEEYDFIMDTKLPPEVKYTDEEINSLI